MPLMIERTRLSVRSWRTILARIAPRAVRTDISAWRFIPRTSRRLAMLAQAMRSYEARDPHQEFEFKSRQLSCISWMPAPAGERTALALATARLPSASEKIGVAAKDCGPIW